MNPSTSARQPDWQPSPPRVPQLKYRNSASPDAVATTAIEDCYTAGNQPNVAKPQGLSIRDIRMSMPQNQASERHTPSPPKSSMAPSLMTASQAPTKKKSSLFGGLFAVKEPTQLALSQFSAQLTAQHGSTSATKVPNVRMEKMPQHVPKVNAKWDGIPDAVKQREKRDKELARAAKRQSITTSTVQSNSSERLPRPSESRRSEISDRSSDSDRRSPNSHKRTEDSRTANPHRFYAQSVNSSGDLAAQLRPELLSRPSSVSSAPPSNKSSSSKSLGERAVFEDDISGKAKTSTHKRRTSGKKMSHQLNSSQRPSSKHSRSTSGPKRERSPLAPLLQGSDREVVTLASSGPDVLPLPTRTRKPLTPGNPAFLAGEAQPFELPKEDAEEDALAPVEDASRMTSQQTTREAHQPYAGNDPKQRRSSTNRRISFGERPASANDFHNAQLRPQNTMSKTFGSLLKREQ